MGMTIIKNYSMPHNCYDCDLHNYHECDLTGESIEEDYCWNGNSREKHCPLREIEAIPKDQYEARLKADMVAMLEKISDKFDEQYYVNRHELHDDSLNVGLEQGQQIIQQKIDALKESENG